MLYPQNVKKDSPADRSKVLPLDVILCINGVSVAGASLSTAKRLIAKSGDQMVISVMASSAYRLLTTRRDMMNIIRAIQKDSVVVVSGATTCVDNRPYGIGILDAQVWDDRTQQFSKAFVLTVH